ncbi:LysR family transcriptional regulator [Dialister micraerophilus]|uniref:Transcriptional regulator CpsY n=1 Tax=Dialister micraerophilus DSM 19965 TaxID=888062 RepID=F2BXR7_9FIRM|nr:LysR family transcriptional regulator [Dialister micraerophilus]EGF13202.1 transcriptional regulator CpsY [Dialister micraerophilus DSM 19965]MDU5301409.1 LysR family transcriptional regulator [Dialister micraerophilus]
MTLQQLRYIIAIAEAGSITSAADKLLVSQPSLSKVVNQIEEEMGITIFNRNNRGVYLSEEGLSFLSYSRQVVEQADLLENKYKNKEKQRRVFSITSHHYAFVVNAFVALVKEYGENKYEFSLRETLTNNIIEDVRTSRSEIGVLFLSDFNRKVILKMLEDADLKFTKLFAVKPHIFVSRKNPLAKEKIVKLSDLKNFPRLLYDQGIKNSFYFAEEPQPIINSNKNIIVTDRATIFNLMIGLNGYTIASGVLSSDLNGTEIVAIPLQTDEIMEIGYIKNIDRPLSKICISYINHLKKYIKFYRHNQKLS